MTGFYCLFEDAGFCAYGQRRPRLGKRDDDAVIFHTHASIFNILISTLPLHRGIAEGLFAAVPICAARRTMHGHSPFRRLFLQKALLSPARCAPIYSHAAAAAGVMIAFAGSWL